MKHPGRDMDAVLLAVRYRIPGNDLAANLGVLDLHPLERDTWVLENLLELTVFQSQSWRLTIEEVIESAGDEQEEQQPGTIGDDRAAALFAFFLHCSVLRRSQSE